jgi:hypothetical protein
VPRSVLRFLPRPRHALAGSLQAQVDGKLLVRTAMTGGNRVAIDNMTTGRHIEGNCDSLDPEAAGHEGPRPDAAQRLDELGEHLGHLERGTHAKAQ